MTRKSIYVAAFWIFIVVFVSECSYQYRVSNNDCEIVIKADGTKSAAEVVTEFQKLTVAGMDHGQ